MIISFVICLYLLLNVQCFVMILTFIWMEELGWCIWIFPLRVNIGTFFMWDPFIKVFQNLHRASVHVPTPSLTYPRTEDFIFVSCISSCLLHCFRQSLFFLRSIRVGNLLVLLRWVLLLILTRRWNIGNRINGLAVFQSSGILWRMCPTVYWGTSLLRITITSPWQTAETHRRWVHHLNIRLRDTSLHFCSSLGFNDLLFAGEVWTGAGDAQNIQGLCQQVKHAGWFLVLWGPPKGNAGEKG